jgi:ABC-2 type transport system permease protein
MTRAASATTARDLRTRGGPLTGTGTLLRFMLRRDRVGVIAWVAGLTFLTVLTASSFTTLYATEAERQSLVATLESPAAVAMTGVNHSPDDYHYGAILGHQMLFFTVLLAGLMSLLLVVRHTRQEESTGRAELVRSAVVGRHATLAAALLTAAVANAALALALAVALGASGIDGITWGGSWLYGAAHAAVGLTFAGIAAVTAQVSEHPRGATSMALAALGLAYVLRALGDVGGNVLSWFSPIGWAQATQVYVNDHWAPLAIAPVATLGLAALAVALSTRRDVGAGLLPPRPGVARASDTLATPLGFALRIHRGAMIGWAVAMLVLGVMYGSVLGEAETWLAEIEAMGDMLPQVAGVGMTELFGAMVTGIMAIFAAVYGTIAAQRMRAEETAGRAEPVIATGLSRARWVMSHVAVVGAGAVVVLLAGGLGLGLTGAAAIGDAGLLPRLVGASLAYAPAVWVVIGLVVALYGFLPRAVGAAWILVLYAFLVTYLGGLLQLPGWAGSLSPFDHVPLLPAEAFALAPLLVLTAIAGVLVAIGLAGFGRRDVPST